MGDLLFFSLGSGSSGNCYFLGTEHYGILLDVGISQRRIQKRLRDVNVPFEKIFGIVLTHAHADHVRGANSISSTFHIPFYATAETFEQMSIGYRSQYKVEKSDQHDIEHFNQFSIGEFNITAFPLSHDLPNVGYKIEFRGKVLTLATDLGEGTDYLKESIKQSDYLILESNYDEEMLMNGNYPFLLKKRILGNSGHLSNKQSSELLASCGDLKLKKLFLCHLSAHNNTPELVRKAFEPLMPNPNSIIVLPRLEPTRMMEL